MTQKDQVMADMQIDMVNFRVHVPKYMSASRIEMFNKDMFDICKAMIFDVVYDCAHLDVMHLPQTVLRKLTG